MIGFKPENIVPTFSSIPLENIQLFDKNSAYLKDSMVTYGNYKYVALKDITPTVQFTWNSLDVNNKFGFDLYNNIQIPNPTNVYCTTSTIVWSVRNKKYYQAKANGYINFTIQDPLAPANFNDLGANPTPLYRIALDFPNGRKDTLSWGYQGSLNRYIMFDSVLNAQTINDRSFTDTGTITLSGNTCTLSHALSDKINVSDLIKITGTVNNNHYFKIVSIATNRLSFTVDIPFVSEVTSLITLYTQTYVKFSGLGIDRVALFDIDCDYVNLKYSINGVEKVNQDIEMSDSSFITTFQLFCFNMPRKKRKEIFEIIPDFNQDFEITFYGDTQKIGKLIVGKSIDMGMVEDSVTVDSKVYGEIEEASNGDIYIPTELTQKDVLDRKSFTLIVNKDEFNAVTNRVKELQGNRVVVSGSEQQGDKVPFLLTYGLIRDKSDKPKVKEDYNLYQIEIREFKEWQS